MHDIIVMLSKLAEGLKYKHQSDMLNYSDMPCQCAQGSEISKVVLREANFCLNGDSLFWIAAFNIRIQVQNDAVGV